MAEEVTKVTCAVCWSEGEVSEVNRRPELGRPDGWATALIVSNEGVLTNSLLCDECLTGVKNVLRDRRQANDKSQTAVPDESRPEVKRNAARRKRVEEIKEEQTVVPAAPVQSDAPVETPPVQSDLPKQTPPVDADGSSDV